MKTVAILNYGIGNVRSIYNALHTVGVKPVLSKEAEQIMAADMVILPGVGAFTKGMQNLIDHKLVEPIHAFIKTGKPFLGVCLGMQMLLDESEEFGISKGLGLIKGRVKKLEAKNFRLPHVSWNGIEPPAGRDWKSTILESITAGEDMYFVHSFAAFPSDEKNVLAVTSYEGIYFCSAVRHENVYGAQFHPEKSGSKGLEILSKFVAL